MEAYFQGLRGELISASVPGDRNLREGTIMTKPTQSDAPNASSSSQWNSFRLSPFREIQRGRCRWSSASHITAAGLWKLMGSGRNRRAWPKEPRGDSFNNRRYFEAFGSRLPTSVQEDGPHTANPPSLRLFRATKGRPWLLAFPWRLWMLREIIAQGSPISRGGSFLSAPGNRARGQPICQTSRIAELLAGRLRSAGAPWCDAILAVSFKPGRRSRLYGTQACRQGSADPEDEAEGGSGRRRQAARSIGKNMVRPKQRAF